MTKELELRMYFFVPYQLTGIQKGIQAGHALNEFFLKHGSSELFKEWAEKWKTFILLDGGTTNNKVDPETKQFYGTLNQIKEKLLYFNFHHKDDPILFADFHEPDLNNALTAICFIADERVWAVPDYENYVSGEPEFGPDPTYLFWLKEILGGEKNKLLKELTSNKPKA